MQNQRRGVKKRNRGGEKGVEGRGAVEWRIVKETGMAGLSDDLSSDFTRNLDSSSQLLDRVGIPRLIYHKSPKSSTNHVGPTDYAY